MIERIRYVDESGSLIFEEPMIFKRLFAVGQEVVIKSRHYTVVGVAVVDAIQIVSLRAS